MADSVRGVLSFTVAGQVHTVRPSHALLDDMEVALGGGVLLLLDEMQKAAPRMGLIVKCAQAVLRHAEPPYDGDMTDATLGEGAMRWLLDKDGPEGMGILPQLVTVINYGPDVLRDALAKTTAGDDSGQSKKKPS